MRISASKGMDCSRRRFLDEKGNVLYTNWERTGLLPAESLLSVWESIIHGEDAPGGARAVITIRMWEEAEESVNS